jgi:hypothetical protein
MQTRLCVWAVAVAALAGLSSQAMGQYDPAAMYGGGPPPGGMYGGGPPPGGMYGGGPPPGAMYGGASVQPAGFGRGMAGGMSGGMSAQPGYGPGCSAGCGGGGCNGCCDCCPRGAWCHHIGVFGEGLYLRPRGVEVAYAVPVDDDGNDPAYQLDAVRVLDPDYQPGFRAGFNFTVGECSLVEVTYTQFNADADDFFQLEGGLGATLGELVSPPALNTAGTNLDSQAEMDVKFQQIDADYLGLLAYCDDYRVAYSVGVRYGKLDQEFAALFSPNDTRLVATDIEFEGAGLKLGALAERYGRNRNLYVYGKGDVAFLGGEFRSEYFSATEIGQGPFVDTSWKAGRLVTVTDLEVGMGWQNCSGCIRVQGGYMYSVWYNVVKTQEWINAVQENNFADPSDNFYGMVSFDGFTARVEFLW